MRKFLQLRHFSRCISFRLTLASTSLNIPCSSTPWTRILAGFKVFECKKTRCFTACGQRPSGQSIWPLGKNSRRLLHWLRGLTMVNVSLIFSSYLDSSCLCIQGNIDNNVLIIKQNIWKIQPCHKYCRWMWPLYSSKGNIQAIGELLPDTNQQTMWSTELTDLVMLCLRSAVDGVATEGKRSFARLIEKALWGLWASEPWTNPWPQTNPLYLAEKGSQTGLHAVPAREAVSSKFKGDLSCNDVAFKQKETVSLTFGTQTLPLLKLVHVLRFTV